MARTFRSERAAAAACVLLAVLLTPAFARAQGTPGTAAAPPSKAAAARDTLGRETPRGTVLRFMEAARKANDDLAPQYLNTPLRGVAANELAHKLFVVLDIRLPPRLRELSDSPDGGLGVPLQPDQDLVGTIQTASGTLDIIVERVNRRDVGPIWLFSRKTLDAVPDVYDEVNLVSIDRYLPSILGWRIAGVRAFEWLALVLLVPLAYRGFGLLDRVIRVPGWVRVLVVALVIRWLISTLELPLVERRFWAGIAAMMFIGALTWALLRLSASLERYAYRRRVMAGRGELVAPLRLARRLMECLVIVAGVLVALRYFGVDPTAALAGLGIGGIAVALAAQKTLENVIGGLSIIFDQAVRVGDVVKVGDTKGTVDSVGLRSTRVLTLDRTLISVPNGQIANANIEILSGRDKFSFSHIVSLQRQTTAAQMRDAVDNIHAYLRSHPMVDRSVPVRVRFFRLGPFSLDVEVFAYILAADWERFMDTQQELLLGIMEAIERAGAELALPSQTLHVANTGAPAPASRPAAGHSARRGLSSELTKMTESSVL